MWYNKNGMKPSTIAALLRRDKSTLTQFLFMRKEREQAGRPKVFTDEQVDRIVEAHEDLIVETNQEYRVTVGDSKRKLRLKASKHTILKAHHNQSIYFRPNCEKPDLTEKGIADRLLRVSRTCATRVPHVFLTCSTRVPHVFHCILPYILVAGQHQLSF